METIVKVEHWFSIRDGIFIRAFGSYKATHALPNISIDNMLSQEVCYQKTQGFLKILSKGKKKPCRAFPLLIKAYVVENFKEVEVKTNALNGHRFMTLNYCTHDHEKVVDVHHGRN